MFNRSPFTTIFTVGGYQWRGPCRFGQIPAALMQVVGIDGGHFKRSWSCVLHTLSTKDSNEIANHMATVLADKGRDQPKFSSRECV